MLFFNLNRKCSLLHSPGAPLQGWGWLRAAGLWGWRGPWDPSPACPLGQGPGGTLWGAALRVEGGSSAPSLPAAAPHRRPPPPERYPQLQQPMHGGEGASSGPPGGSGAPLRPLVRDAAIL